MFHRLILPLLDAIPAMGKITIASFLAAGAVIADAVTELRGWEDVSLKVALMAALIFVVRLLLRQQAEHKAECKDIVAQHRAEYLVRETAMQSVLQRNTDAVSRVAELTEQQTKYFQDIARTIVNERLKLTKPSSDASAVKY